MRLAGQDEVLHAEPVALLDPIGHLLVAADQGGAGVPAQQAESGPEVGVDLQASAAVSRVMTWNRTPNRTRRPARAASFRTRSSCSTSSGGGSPQARWTSAWRAETGAAAADAPPRKISGRGWGTGRR